MPIYLHPYGGGYAHGAPNSRGAFAVSLDTVARWDDLVAAQGFRPVNSYGYRVRPYPAMNVAAHAPFAPDGVYTDHTDPAVERDAFAMRSRLIAASVGSRQEVLATIATALGLRHWRDAYNCTRNVGRRQTGESGRDAATGTLVWRRWGRPIWSPAATASATTVAAASGSRCIGVELEFNRDAYTGHLPGMHHHYVTERAHDIASQARLAGLRFTERWNSYGRNMSVDGWQGTYDSTTTGGEIISDILPGDDAAMVEIRTMLAIIRDHGGVAAERQGVHVHVDCRDLDDAAKVRLVDNLQLVAPILEQYLPASRRSGYWCGRLGASDWAAERSLIAAGRPGRGGHAGPSAYNFGHLYGPSPRIEFRSFGHSLNSAKLRCWIRVCQAIVTATASGYRVGPAVDTVSMLAFLRNHGNLSAAAAERFADTVTRRSGVRVTV